MWSEAYTPRQPVFISDPHWRPYAWRIRRLLWAPRELAWWGVIALFGAILACQLWRAPAIEALLWWRRPGIPGRLADEIPADP
jgi:hypothetical protein